jgi:hypothetical protein
MADASEAMEKHVNILPVKKTSLIHIVTHQLFNLIPLLSQGINSLCAFDHRFFHDAWAHFTGKGLIVLKIYIRIVLHALPTKE